MRGVITIIIIIIHSLSFFHFAQLRVALGIRSAYSNSMKRNVIVSSGSCWWQKEALNFDAIYIIYNGPVGPPGEWAVAQKPKWQKQTSASENFQFFVVNLNKQKQNNSIPRWWCVSVSLLSECLMDFPLCSHRTEYWILSNNYASKLGRPWSSNVLKRINERRRIWPKVGPCYLVMWSSSSSILSHLWKWEITASKDS